MPRFEIKIAHEPNIKVPTFSEQQMTEIGNYAIQVMKERTLSSTDVFDRPAKPLQPKYAKRKEKKGLPPVRDIKFTGVTQTSIKVLDADESHVKVGFSNSVAFRKALFNQNIDPWFGLSGHDDERVLHEKVQPLFSQNVADAVK